MAGDPLRDAFRAELQSVVTAASITWPIKDTLNTAPPIDASESYITLQYGGGIEQPAWFAGTGNNGWAENGIIYVDLITSAGDGAETAERYADLIRKGFRNRRFATAEGRAVRILAVGPFGGGEDEGVGWKETVPIEYRAFNIG
jgi:hypothetical protein